MILILTLEPLFCMIWAIADIRNLQKRIKPLHLQTTLYFIIADPLITLPNVLQALHEYGSLSYFI